MRAFLIGLLFIIAVAVLSGIGILLYPLLLVLGVFFRLVLGFVLVIFAIWLLGKFIIFIWEALFRKK